MYRSQQTKALALARHIAVAVVIPGLIGAGAVLGPGGPGPSLVRGEPTASPVSHARFRDEERSTVEAAPNPTQSITVSSAPPARSEQTPALTALTGLPTAEEAMRATRIAQEKIKVERAKRWLARERARARTIAARRLDPFHGQPTRSVYSYAPHRTYGPFNQTGKAGVTGGMQGRFC